MKQKKNLKFVFRDSEIESIFLLGIFIIIACNYDIYK